MIALMDLACPKLPIEMGDFTEWDLMIFKERWDEILSELQDQNMAGRTHGRVATYEAGCHGPICRKEHKFYKSKRRRSGDALIVWDVEDAVTEYFHVIARFRLDTYKRELLDSIKAG